MDFKIVDLNQTALNGFCCNEKKIWIQIFLGFSIEIRDSSENFQNLAQGQFNHLSSLFRKQVVQECSTFDSVGVCPAWKSGS